MIKIELTYNYESDNYNAKVVVLIGKIFPQKTGTILRRMASSLLIKIFQKII
jgi:hypothetical protein